MHLTRRLPPLLPRLLTQAPAAHRDLHSFPTRRSSELGEGGEHAEATFVLGTIAVYTDEFSAADRKSTRRNSSHSSISYAVFCLKKKRLLTRTGGVRGHRLWAL